MGLKTMIQSVLKEKVTPLITKAKNWFSPGYMKNQGMVKVRDGMKKLLDVHPRDEADYYSIWHWMVSKRLALAVTVITLFLCVCYLAAFIPEWDTAGSNGIKTYRYNALPLKYMCGKVRILANSGYQAYVGEVDQGSVTGEGTLYDKNGDTVYTGEFSHNQYNGRGQLYYGKNILRYEGSFKENMYHGEGILYRQEGTKEYEGSFAQNQKDGNGQLFDNSGNLVYSGSFRKDRIVYQALMGKTTAKVAEMYTGRQVIYDNGTVFCVSMPDIQAVYYSESGAGGLEEEWVVKGVYVLEDTIMIAGEPTDDIAQLKEQLGQPVYEGNTVISLADAVAIEEANKKHTVLQGKVLMKKTQILEDVIQIDSYDNGYLAYLYIFEKEGCTYTFFCQDKDTGFAFYLIEEA